MKDNQLTRELQQVNNTVKDTSKMQQGKKSHDQGDQWQAQKKKQNKHQEQANPKTVWKPTYFQHKEGMKNQQNPAQAGMTLNVPTHNNFTSLDVQEQVTNSLYGLDTSNKTLTKEDQTSQDLGKIVNSTSSQNEQHSQKNQNAGISSNMEPVIDLRLPLPYNPTVISVELVEEGESTNQLQVPIIHHGSKHQASHQLDIGKSLQGLGKENPYTGTSARQQEKEGLHSQIPQKDAGNTPTQPSNNKSQARLRKRRRNAIKKRQQKEMETENKQQGQKEEVEDYDEYGVPNSKDEYDEDTQSLDDNDDEEDEITTTFGATFQTDYEEEIQEIKRQQGLSPRGRKETRHNTTRARGRPLTRARSRGL
ncbi:uncharacterized protein LOC125868473 [Solanum stenotomum]|uniref:uncharacterized protein LOC125868473 n=1 Tax=Solanum stenotomum TaxID=172797 RepID=UPI0020D0CD76|nr:uncharacterized protein LOC125868473 [Solanum stenotomum]